MRLLPVALALLLAACGPKDTTVQDVRDIRKSYYEFRDALLQGDDRAFFSLHCAEARRWAVDNFPSVRAEFLTGGAEGRAAFLRQYRVTEEEFLKGDPRDLVARMMPWKSGWADRREDLRAARVRDVAIEYVPGPGGELRRWGVVSLEGAGGAALPDVVFVKDPEGWRRHSFFVEVVEVAPPKKPGG